MNKTSLLIADTPQAIEFLKDVLDDTVAIVPGPTFEAATMLASPAVRGVIVGLHFDEGRMFDFVRFVRSSQATRERPVVCIRVLPDRFRGATLEGLHVSCVAVGAAAYIDFFETEAQVGQSRAKVEFRRQILSHFGMVDAADTVTPTFNDGVGIQPSNGANSPAPLR